MFPGFETDFGNGIVHGRGDGNTHDIDLFQKVRQVAKRPCAVLTTDKRSPLAVVIDDADQRRIGQRGIQSRMVPSKMSDPDDTGTKFGHIPLGLSLGID
jgi:hypothetical protein